MKEKKYYFIQIEKDFFQSQKMEELKEQALDDEENPFVYIAIYQMLILSSLENNGFIFIDNNKTMMATDATTACRKRRLTGI